MFPESLQKFNKKNETDLPFRKPVDEVAEAETVAKETEDVSSNQSTSVVTSASNLELKLVKPERFEEVATVANYVIDGCAVFLNIELLDSETGTKMLDFLSGVCYAIGGRVTPSSQNTFIIAPSNIAVSD